MSAFCGFDGFTSPDAMPVMNSYWPTWGNEWPPKAMPRVRMVIWVIRACAEDAVARALAARRAATPSRMRLRLGGSGARANGAPCAVSIMLYPPVLLSLVHRLAGSAT